MSKSLIVLAVMSLFASFASADCEYYWNGSGWVWRCEEPSPIPTGPDCHWETNAEGKVFWVCD